VASDCVSSNGVVTSGAAGGSVPPSGTLAGSVPPPSDPVSPPLLPLSPPPFSTPGMESGGVPPSSAGGVPSPPPSSAGGGGGLPPPASAGGVSVPASCAYAASGESTNVMESTTAKSCLRRTSRVHQRYLPRPIYMKVI